MRLLKQVGKLRWFAIVISYIAKSYMLFVWLTARVNCDIDHQASEILRKKQSCILSLWHSYIFIMPYFMKRFGIFGAVVSSHSDGRYLVEYLKRFGHVPIIGSSNKKAFSAMRGVLTMLREGGSVAITPDGPRGPRHKVSGNITAIAAKAELPIIMLAFHASHKIVLNTWDKFIIPLPFAHITVSISAPIYCDKYKLEENRDFLEQSMIAQLTK